MKVTEAPKRFPALTLDRLLHVARHLHDGQSRYVITFSGRLDTPRIRRAVELSVHAEPVLGCRFVPRPWRPYWETVAGKDLASLMTVVETHNNTALHAWLGTPLHADKDVQVHASLFRGDKDKLAVKLSHEAADFGGCFDYLVLLGNIYRELGRDPAFVPPVTRKRFGQTPVLRKAGFRQVLRGCFHFSTPGPGLDFRARSVKPAIPAFSSRNLGTERSARIRQYSRKHSVSLNDVLLAAFYRAQFLEFASPPDAALTIPIPINLRRHLPDDGARGVCNLPAVFFAGAKNQDFETLVADVHRVMETARSNMPWLGQALFVELMFLLPYGLIGRLATRSILRGISSGKIYPYISNDGIIDTGRLDFGDRAIVDFETWGPVPNHSLPILSVYTVGDTLGATIATRDELNGQRAERLVDAYLQQLPT